MKLLFPVYKTYWNWTHIWYHLKKKSSEGRNILDTPLCIIDYSCQLICRQNFALNVDLVGCRLSVLLYWTRQTTDG